MLTLTQARPGEESICMEIIADGRQFQQEQGFIQWTEDYPALPDIAGDIAAARDTCSGKGIPCWDTFAWILTGSLPIPVSPKEAGAGRSPMA